jgi:hypothetical protein
MNPEKTKDILHKRLQGILESDPTESFQDGQILLRDIDAFEQQLAAQRGTEALAGRWQPELNKMETALKEFLEAFFIPRVENHNQTLKFDTPYLSQSKVREDRHTVGISKSLFKLLFEFNKKGRFRFIHFVPTHEPHSQILKLRRRPYKISETYELWDGKDIRFNYTYYNEIYRFEGEVITNGIIGSYTNFHESETFEVIDLAAG